MNSKPPVRVLIVDDSAFMRKAIREMLSHDARVQVVDAAFSGSDALEKITELRPDVVTIDLIMPDINGVDLIRMQMARQPLPMVVVSSAVGVGEMVLQAMDAGAVEFVHKPTNRALDEIFSIQNELVQAVLAASQVSFEKLSELVREPAVPVSAIHAPHEPGSQSADAVLIGVSTGGPKALRYLLPLFPENFPAAIAIALHMPVGYTSALSQRLNEVSRLEVVESSNGTRMKAGRAILSKAGFTTRLVRQPGGSVVTELSEPSSDDGFYVPSVDALFQSGAEVYGSRLICVVLTGMGNDGTAGAGWVKAQGGRVFAEAESSSVVYGMPRSVAEAGLADRIEPLSKIVETIIENV